MQYLQIQAYEAFLPLIKTEKIRQGARASILVALFLKYLFVQLDEAGSQTWGPIRFTVGVPRLVKFGNRFAEVSQELVAWVQEQVQVTKVAEQFKEGDVVSVTQGPLKGVEAIFKSMMVRKEPYCF